MLQKSITYLSILIIVIGVIFLANGLILAWSPPGSAPPAGNVDAPINVGSDTQYKAGALGVGGVFRGGGAIAEFGPGSTSASRGITWDGGASTAWDLLTLENDNGVMLKVIGNGNVGIGTTGPRSPLQLGQVFALQQDVNSGYIGANFGDSTGGNYIKSQYAVQQHFDSATGKIHFKTAVSGTAGNAISWDTRMTILNNGNVGIGTAGPDFKFDVRDNSSGWASRITNTSASNAHVYMSHGGGYGMHIRNDSATASTYLLELYNSGTRFIVQGDGKVGIGTASPVYGLEVVRDGWKARFSGSDGYIDIGPANSGWAHIYSDRPNFIFNKDVWSIPGGFSSYSTADLYLKTNGTTRMTISNSSGNVGIGTASPGAKLDIVANSQTWGDWYEAIRFSQGAHSAITHPGGGLLFGLHGNRNFYWANTTDGYYAMTLSATGNLNIKGSYSGPGCDIAELYEPSQDSEELESGDIVVLDEEQEMKIKKSSQAYSTMIIGVISTNPNMTMGVLKDNEDYPPVALLGRVSTKVTAENGPIKIGDLIVSSSKSGYGMKCDDYDKCKGAIVGKALQNLESGQGMIEVLMKGGF